MEEHAPEQPKKQGVPTASAVLDDETIIELLFQAKQNRTLLVLFNAGRWTLRDHIDVPQPGRLVPFSPHNNLIKNEVILLASEPHAYGTERELVADIKSFIHRYADLSPAFEDVACYHVLLTWVYDAFNDLP